MFDELTRNPELSNDDREDIDEEGQEIIEETFSTWHRENKNSGQNQTFLQFELEHGTKTKMMGSGARESDEADQAMAMVQGSSGMSRKKDYSRLESLDKKEDAKGSQSQAPYGERNKDAAKILKKAGKPTNEDKNLYQQFKKEIEAEKRLSLIHI